MQESIMNKILKFKESHKTVPCWRIDAFELEKTLESPLDSKEIKSVIPKGNQPWIFIGRTDAEVEAPTLWPTDVKSQLTGKDPDAGKDWGQDKGTIEDEMVKQHHGHEFWINSGRQWRTGKPGMLQSMGSHRVWHNLKNEQQRTITMPNYIGARGKRKNQYYWSFFL